MSNVYIVFRGSYSDTHVVAVFSKREDADKLVEYSTDGYVEEWELDEMPVNFPCGRLSRTRTGKS